MIEELKHGLEAKIEIIKSLLANQRVAVAFSGGMDSSLVCYLSKLFADDVLAVMVKDPTTSSIELGRAKMFSEMYEIPLKIVESNPLNIDEFRENSENRCYYCKKTVFGLIQSIARKEKSTMVVDGTNVSDLTDIRPGIRAARELNVKSPLAEAELSKEEIREISKSYGLPSQYYPAQACLASRVPFDTPLSESLLKMIDEAENAIRRILNEKYLPLRVRVHSLGLPNFYLARIESNNGFLKKICQNPELRERIIENVLDLGFVFVTVDLEGFYTGKMHRIKNRD